MKLASWHWRVGLAALLLALLPAALWAEPSVVDPSFELLSTWGQGVAGSVGTLEATGTCTGVAPQALGDSTQSWGDNQFVGGGYDVRYLRVFATGTGITVEHWYTISANNATVISIAAGDLLVDAVQPGDGYEVWQDVGMICDSTGNPPEYYLLEMTSGAAAGTRYALAEGWSMPPNCVRGLGNLVRAGVAPGDAWLVGYDSLSNWPSYVADGWYTDMNWHTWSQGGVNPHDGLGEISVFHEQADWKASRFTTISGLTVGQKTWAIVWVSTHSLKVAPGYPPIRNLWGRIGVDVTGGTVPTAASVKWAETQSDIGGEWRQVYVDFIPTATTATLFLMADARTSGIYTQNVIGFDQVELTTLGPPLTITADPIVQVTTGRDDQALVVWATNLPTKESSVYYRVAGSGGAFTKVSVVEADLTSHTITLTGLQNATTYEYYVDSKGTQGAPNFAVESGTATQVVSNLIRDISKSWTTNQWQYKTCRITSGPATGKTYSITTSGSNYLGVSPATLVTDGVVVGNTFQILTPAVQSSHYQFSTPIQFSNISIGLTGNPSEMMVHFISDADVTCYVEYGPTTGYGSVAVVDENADSLVYDFRLIGLTPGQLVHFRVKADAQGNYRAAASADKSFHALPTPTPNGGTPGVANGSFELTATEQGMTLTELDKALYPNVATYGSHPTETRQYPWVSYTVDASVFPPGCATVQCADAVFRCWCEGVGYNPITGVAGPYPVGGPDFWQGGDELRAPDGSYFMVDTSGFGFHNGGVFQRIEYPNNTPVTVTARSYVRQDPPPSPGHIDDNNLIGIDPNGGIDPMSPNVVWQPWYEPQGAWGQAGATVMSGTSGVVTIFVHMSEQWRIALHAHGLDDVKVSQPITKPIGELKTEGLGIGVSLQGKVVTCPQQMYNTDGRFYIEEPDRTSAIAVIPLGVASPALGQSVSVVGTLDRIDGEAVINRAEVTLGSPATAPAPVSMNNVNLGGAALGVQYAMSDRGNGPSSTGMLVTTWGRIVAVNHPNDAAEYFYLDDGSNVAADYHFYEDPPGIWNLDYQSRGVKVFHTTNSEFWVGQYVVVTGVLGMRVTDDNGPPAGGAASYYRCIYTRDDYTDILQLPG